MHRALAVSFALLLSAVPLISGEEVPFASPLDGQEELDLQCLQYGPDTPEAIRKHEAEELTQQQLQEAKKEQRNAILERLAAFAERHALKGTASYYSTFFDGRKTANGEIYRNASFSAAHLTLPLGCWVEVRCLATGRKIRLRVNDRGPYSGGFVLDLSQSAARALGVDRTVDRRVEITVIALPGEEPPAEGELPQTVASK